MKVLVVGGGGREHVICWKLKQDPRVTELYCAPGNGGIASIATCVNIKATDIEGMVEYAKKEQFDLVFVAPDDPLAMGMVDKLEEAGLRSFGPKANAAIIEGSKAFSKQLMKKYSIPTAKYEIFDDEQKALAYLETQPMPIVIRVDDASAVVVKGYSCVYLSEEAILVNGVKHKDISELISETGAKSWMHYLK